MEETPATSSDNIGARARTAAGWRFLSQGINTALQMATSIVLARLLMPADFGIVAMALMVSGFAALFSDLGLGQALVQRKEISHEHTRSAFSGTLVMAIVLYGAVYLAAPYLGDFFHEPRMVPVLRIIALTFLISPFAQVPRSLLQRSLDFRTLFFAGLAGSIAYGGVGITMALLGYGYWALVGAPLAARLADTISLCTLMRYRPPLVPSFRGIGDLCGFGLGVTATGLFGFIAGQTDYLVIGRRLDTDALGLYERAYKLMSLPLFIPVVSFAVLFPAFAHLQHDAERARNAFSRILSLTTLFTWPSYAVMLVIAPECVPLVFGEQWTEAVVATQILTMAGFAKVVIETARTAARAMGTRYVWGDAWRLAVYALAIGGGDGGQPSGG